MARTTLHSLLVAACLASPALAQVLPSGVINSPPTTIGRFRSIDSDTTLNVFDGGSVGFLFNAGLEDGSSSNVVVNIHGGYITPEFTANAGSTVNMTGGVASFLVSNPGSTITISGGLISGIYKTRTNSDVEVLGGEFFLNGIPHRGETVSLEFDDSFTGTLADGSPFVLTGTINELKTTSAPLPPIDTNPIIIDSEGETMQNGLRSGQTATLSGDGRLVDYLNVVDATLNIDGGRIAGNDDASGAIIKTARSTVNISGGSFRPGGIFAYDSSTINITDGYTRSLVRIREASSLDLSGGLIREAQVSGTAHIRGGVIEEEMGVGGPGSRAFISGGVIGRMGGTRRYLQAYQDSITAITGGVIGGGFYAYEGSTVLVRGGSFGHRFNNEHGSLVLFSGNDFQLNGAPYNGSSITLTEDDVFTGVFSDGSPFMFSDGYDTLRSVQLQLTGLPEVDTTPLTADANTPAPSGIRDGQTLNLLEGSLLRENFTALNATLNIDGGMVSFDTHVASSQVNLRSGSIDQGFKARLSSRLHVSGGVVGSDLEIDGGSQAEVSEGSIGGFFTARDSSTLVVNGGDVGDNGTIDDGHLIVSGGTLGDRLTAENGGTIDLVGGSIGDGLVVQSGSEISVDGGEIGSGFDLRHGVANISAGSIGSDFAIGGFFRDATANIKGGELSELWVKRQGVANISGGSIADEILASGGSTINLSGTEFTQSGNLLTLTPGVPTEVQVHNGPLTATLASGELFDINASRDNINGFATITVTLLPEPGDYNGDGVVDASDSQAWRDTYREQVPHFSGADGNGDGVIDAADYTVWRDAFDAAVAATVPEPAYAFLLAICLLAAGLGRAPRQSHALD